MSGTNTKDIINWIICREYQPAHLLLGSNLSRPHVPWLPAIKEQSMAERKRERVKDRDREVWRNQSPIMNSKNLKLES